MSRFQLLKSSLEESLGVQVRQRKPLFGYDLHPDVVEDLEFDRPTKLSEEEVNQLIVNTYSGSGFSFLPNLREKLLHFNGEGCMLVVNANVFNERVAITSFKFPGLQYKK